MYRQRLYFFIFVCFLAVSVCFVRLAYMQVVGKEKARKIITGSRIWSAKQTPTVRGSIFDRNENELAADKAQFKVKISYKLTRYADKNFWRGIIESETTSKKSFAQARDELHDKYEKEIEALHQTVYTCSKLLQVDPKTLYANIAAINVGIWRLREVVVWKKTFPESELYLRYKEMGREAPYSLAMIDFEERLAAMDETSAPSDRMKNAKAMRYKLAYEEKLAEGLQAHPIYEIRTRGQLLDIQLEFRGNKHVKIAPITERVYKYGATACQIIGWVGPAQNDENALFPKDVYSLYNAEDFSGKGGIEAACEVILRGKRGEVIYNHDDELLSQKPRQFGEDIHLSIDIKLQHSIENYLSDKTIFPDPNAVMGSVVIDVASGEILAMVSIPTYDLRFIRKSKVYNAVSSASTEPFKSKAMYDTFPPGSIVKPMFLAMGLEMGKVTAGEIISCPGTDPPSGWPDCIIHRKGGGSHDRRWASQGGNIARNAIRGSCNIYFSRLVDRMSSAAIQNWLYRFGLGHRILTPPNYPELLKELKRTDSKAADRRLQEADGIISSELPLFQIKNLFDLPKIKSFDKRHFGIGQASMRVTVLQVANAMAALARGGVYKAPRLYISDAENKKNRPMPIGISNATMRVVRDGMRAVVYESGGTGSDAFKKGKYKEKFKERKIEVFGKTGSTQSPPNAWFAGFAEDKSGRALAFAIVVKDGKSGSQDAAPKGFKILDMCTDMGYIGVTPKAAVSE